MQISLVKLEETLLKQQTPEQTYPYTPAAAAAAAGAAAAAAALAEIAVDTTCWLATRGICCC